MKNRVNNRLRRQLRVVSVISALVIAGACRAQSLADGALVQALRQGGYVLVMRHASSPEALPDKSIAQLDNIKLERQLDQIGRDTAREMGMSIQRLKIPIADIESSPTYRALQTIKLQGLGEPKIVPALGFGRPDSSADEDAKQFAWLRRRVTVVPRTGTNTLLVTHAPNITGAFGQNAADIEHGESLVFHPDGKGAGPLVARIKIEKWTRMTVAAH